MSTDKTISESWLQIAEDDLNSAKKLNSQPNPIWSTAVYHCQQAAEKAAKALLAFHGEEPPFKKGHDIGYLLERLEAYGDALDDLDVEAATLSEFATSYRYPNPSTKPLTQEVVDKAIQDAETFLFRSKKIVEEVTNTDQPVPPPSETNP